MGMLHSIVNQVDDTLTPPKLLEFIKEGGNLILVGSSNLGEVIREVASELGVEFDSTGGRVLDYFEHIGNDIDRIRSRQFNRRIVDGNTVAEDQYVEFRGIGQVLSGGTSSLALPILSAGPYAFTDNMETAVRGSVGDSSDGYPFAMGRRIVLVSGFQARNNARALILGSDEMFRNS